MRYLLFGILLFIGYISGLAQIVPDSLAFFYQTPPVEIVEEKSRAYSSLSETALNFQNQTEYQTQDLATYLDRKGLAQINMNGATGSAAAIRFRGTSSDHTTLFWKGFSINSVSLGSSDLSMIPLFFVDGATLINSPGAAKLPGANIGAGIDLLSNQKKLDSSQIKLIGSYNSLHNSFYGIDIPLVFDIGKLIDENGQKHFKGQLMVRTRAFDQRITNDFKYTDIYQFDRPVVKQHHNNGRAGGVMNEISFINGAHKFELSSWYQQKRINLPAIMGVIVPGTAEQSDELFRSSFNYNYTRNNTGFGFSAAYFNDATHYRDDLNYQGEWATESKIHSHGVLNRMNVEHAFKKIKVTADVLSSYYDVKNVSYKNGSIRKHWGQVGTSISYLFKPIHQFQAGLRYDIRDSRTKPAFSFNYKMLRKTSAQNPLFEIQISKSYRPADFNERFWFPGGNTDLRPEEGMNYMINSGIEFSIGKFEFKSKPGLFYSDINNWIQWIPQSGGIWSPVNFKHVRSHGAELPITVSHDLKSIFIQTEIRYSYTDSRGVNSNEWINDKDFVMIYTPKHVLYAELLLRYKKLTIGLQDKYTSARYTDESNTEVRALAPYHLAGSFVSGSFERGNNKLECRFSIDNLLDVRYESVRAYAMPGRVLQLTLNYQFGINKIKNK